MNNPQPTFPDLAALSPNIVEKIAAIRLIVFDFDGVFTDNMVFVFEDGREAVRCSRSDGMGLRKLPALKIEAMIISTEVNPVVLARAKKLKLPCIQACEDKWAALQIVMQERNLTSEQISFVGNDINDLCCLEKVGLPIVVGDAHADVVSSALYQTRAIGGNGAVREVCDLFERVLISNNPNEPNIAAKGVLP